MQYQGIDFTVDSVKERDSIIQFLNDYWTIETRKPLSEVIDSLLQNGIEYGIAYKESNIQRDISDREYFCPGLTDALKFQKTSTISEFDFQSYIKPIVKETRKFIIVAEPKDHNLSDTDKALIYNGSKLHYSIGACSFPLVKALSKSVIEEEHRLPTDALVDAVFLQGMSIGINTVEVKYDDWYISRSILRLLAEDTKFLEKYNNRRIEFLNKDTSKEDALLIQHYNETKKRIEGNK